MTTTKKGVETIKCERKAPMFKSRENILEPDLRFSYLRHHDQVGGYIRELRIEDLYEMVRPIELDAVVPLQIRQQFDAARYAFLYSWFAYDLASVAEMQCYSVLEMALRCRLELAELRSPRGLRALANAAIKAGFVAAEHLRMQGDTGDRLSYLDYIVRLRNKLMHGDVHLHPEGTIDIMARCAVIVTTLFRGVEPKTR
jgi:hypothetical protein